MTAFPVPVPNVLGHYFSFASIEAIVNAIPFRGITAINYSSSLEVADVYGTPSGKLGTTRGKVITEGSMEMYVQDWENLRATLGLVGAGIGYGEVRFPIVVCYGEINMPVKVDVLEGCRVLKVEYSNAEGPEASKVTLTLNIMRINENGQRIDVPGVGF